MVPPHLLTLATFLPGSFSRTSAAWTSSLLLYIQVTSLDHEARNLHRCDVFFVLQVLLASPSLTDLQLDPAAQLGAASSITFRNASPPLPRPLLFLPGDCKAAPDNSEPPDNSEEFSDGDLARLRAAPSPVCKVTFSTATAKSLFSFAAGRERTS